VWIHDRYLHDRNLGVGAGAESAEGAEGAASTLGVAGAKRSTEAHATSDIGVCDSSGDTNHMPLIVYENGWSTQEERRYHDVKLNMGAVDGKATDSSAADVDTVQASEHQSLARAYAVNDAQRVLFLANCTSELQKAVNEDGVNVVGYFAWSFLVGQEAPSDTHACVPMLSPLL
jgi:hypothetical protein